MVTIRTVGITAGGTVYSSVEKGNPRWEKTIKKINEYAESKEKEKKKKKAEKKKKDTLIKRLSKAITSKRILKKSQVTVRIKDYKQPSILGESNQFFKDEWNETVKSI